jgi:hypothetical protein
MVPAQKAAWTKSKTKHQEQMNPTQLKNQPDRRILHVDLISASIF